MNERRSGAGRGPGEEGAWLRAWRGRGRGRGRAGPFRCSPAPRPAPVPQLAGPAPVRPSARSPGRRGTERLPEPVSETRRRRRRRRCREPRAHPGPARALRPRLPGRRRRLRASARGPGRPQPQPRRAPPPAECMRLTLLCCTWREERMGEEGARDAGRGGADLGAGRAGTLPWGGHTERQGGRARGGGRACPPRRPGLPRGRAPVSGMSSSFRSPQAPP